MGQAVIVRARTGHIILILPRWLIGGMAGFAGVPFFILVAKDRTKEKRLETIHHEIRHKEQMAAHGWLRFIIKYFAETRKRGYKDNMFEIDARRTASARTQNGENPFKESDG